jgi:hypothetical protein
MSTMRRCDIQFANDGKWYLTLGNYEHAYDDHNSTVYGPFRSQAELELELERHSNPGGASIDDTGTQPPPKVTASAHPRSFYLWLP